MGGTVGIVQTPDKIDLEMFKTLAGDKFTSELFENYAKVDSDGKKYIEKKQVMKFVQKTDCFLTHDWGIDELGRKNHDRVSRLNRCLKERGLLTWFDEEQMTGNIIAQMCAGIDNTQCMIVCVTDRYVNKVGGDNTADNCQKEFNYAEQRKTASKMIATVMEPRMRNKDLWEGPVGMILGGKLYVDLSSDDNFESQADELYKQICLAITPLRQQSAVYESIYQEAMEKERHKLEAMTIPSREESAPAAAEARSTPHGSSLPLDSLSVEDVQHLLDSLNLVQYKQIFLDNGIDGATLSLTDSVEELTELRVLALHAKRLLKVVDEYKTSGVQKELIVPKTGAPTTPVVAAPVAAVVATPVAVATPTRPPQHTASPKTLAVPKCSRSHSLTYCQDVPTAYKQRYSNPTVNCDICRRQRLETSHAMYHCDHCGDFDKCIFCARDEVAASATATSGTIFGGVCLADHPLSHLTTNPYNNVSNVNCNVCKQENLQDLAEGFFHCKTCKNFDMCDSCRSTQQTKINAHQYTIKCNRGHELSRLAGDMPPEYNGEPLCDLCKATRLNTKPYYHHCRTCKFDLCSNCSNARKIGLLQK